MDKIREIREGEKETLRFTSKRGNFGDLSYNDTGFSFESQVGQDVIVPLTYSGELTVDCSKGNIFSLTLTGNCSITLKNPSVSFYTFIVKQDDTGSRSLTFPNSDYYVESDLGAPDLSTSSANQIDIINVFYDGSDYYITGSYNFVEVGTL